MSDLIELSGTYNTIMESHGEEVSNKIIFEGMANPSLTNTQLISMADKYQTPRQLEVEKDFLTTKSAIAGGDTTLNSQTFHDRWMNPDSLAGYNRRDKNLIEERINDLTQQELDITKAQLKEDKDLLNLEKKEYADLKRRVQNLKDLSQFKKDMNIGIFNELDNLIKYTDWEGKIMDEESGVKGTTLEEFQSAGKIQKKVDMSKADVTDYYKVPEILNKMRQNVQQYENLIQSQVGNEDLTSVANIEEQLLQSQAAFLKDLDEFVQTLPADPKSVPTYTSSGEGDSGEFMWSTQKQTPGDYRMAIYNKYKKRYQQYLNGIKVNYDVEPGGETEEVKNPFEQYKKPS